MNSVQLMGNLTRDPETKVTPSGMTVCDATIAVNERYTTQSGEVRETCTFIGLTLFGKTAEAFAKWHKKGEKALVEGKLVQENWDDKKTGEKRTKTKVQVDRWHFVNAKRDEQQTPRPAVQAQKKPVQATLPVTEQDADDVPF